MTMVKEALRFFTKALTNWLYTYKQFHGTSRRMRDAGFVACVRINA